MSMKTRLITLSVILVATISIIVTLLIPKTKMFLGVYDANSGMQKTDQINKSPYAIFGDSSKTLMTENERTSNHTLEIKNTNKGERTFKLELNAQTGKIRLFDKIGNVISELLLEPEQLTRFVSIDRFAEKYYDLTPYHYGANNPILYIDVNGDSISVAEQYRQSYMNDLQKVFGDNSKNFAFNNTGMLSYTGDVANLTDAQKAVFGGMNTLMTQETTTSVVYAESYTVGSGADAKTYNTSEFGGALTAKGVNINGQSQNLIVISPTISDVNVSLDGMMDILSNKQANVQQNTTSGLFHEFGEAITTDINYRGAVIDYENKARAVIGLPVRPYDLNHSKTIKTIYKR